MLKSVDDILNQITMYRLVLYVLIFFLVVATFLSFFKILPFVPTALIFSALFLVGVAWVTNKIFAKTFGAATNFESVYITALILALIISPPRTFVDVSFLFWAAVIAASSKYILAVGKKHLFNPTAFSVAVTAFALGKSASWWVGTTWMLPAVLIGGLLIVRKTKRTDLVFSFLFVALVTILGLSMLRGSNLVPVAKQTLLGSPLLFFAFIMLTEPLTTPPTNFLQTLYGGLVGFLFAPQIHLGSFYTTPEIALLVGNFFSYLVSPKKKLILKLKERIQVGQDIYDFIFHPQEKLAFVPGQYLEWTLPQKNLDSRGNRRYFTLASSPTEEDLRIGVKFYEKPSSFKQALAGMTSQNEIVASQITGDFTLPKNKDQKLVFIAGGIGITPFRSMIKYLLDKGERRTITLFYSCKTANEFVYQDVFTAAASQLGVKTIYVLSDKTQVPPNWGGKVGFIDEQMIKTEVPDYLERGFYLSGPHSMVDAFQTVLKQMGLKNSQIKVDFFPGYA